MRGATRPGERPAKHESISIHAPHAGRDSAYCRYAPRPTDFNPRAPCGARPMACNVSYGTAKFQSTRPMRGATAHGRSRMHGYTNFNPRAPCGARLCRLPHYLALRKFQSTRPMRGATTGRLHIRDWEDKFQSTRPMRGATVQRFRRSPPLAISIHAPHAGRDVAIFSFSRTPHIFQSTRPMRGATQAGRVRHCPGEISIHAPHAGRDGAPAPGNPSRAISIHAPHAGRDVSGRHTAALWIISIHAPHAGRDARDGKVTGDEVISIHAPHAGRDIVIIDSRSGKRYFNPRAPCGARPSPARWSWRSRHFNPRAPCGARLLLRPRGVGVEEFQSTRPMRGATTQCRGALS